MAWDKTKPLDNGFIKDGPGLIREIKELLENSLTDGGLEIYFRICTSATRPDPATLGMLIFETDTKNVYKCVVGGASPTWTELGSYTGLTWQEPVKDRDLAEPPAAPSTGDRYIIDQDTYAISYIHQVNKIFAMAGNYASRFAAEDTFEISGSTGNDGTYTIASVSYNAGESRTELTVDEAIPDATVDGNILHSQGAWNGRYNDVTEWTATTWSFATKIEGMACYCDDETIFIYYNGTNWVSMQVTYYNKHTVTAGEEASGIITVPTYAVGDNSLSVFLNGMLQCITDDYAETNTTTITFVADRLTEDDILIFRG